MSNLFKTLEYEAFRAGITPRTQQSREWFRTRLAGIKQVNRSQIMKEEPVVIANRQAIGGMYHFFYNPKHKDTLPYYDRFPLVIVLGPAESGFLGLNLHYLPPVLRAKFLDALLEVTNNKRYDESTKFKLSYNMLQRISKMKYYKACIKHYLTSHVISKFARIPAPEWEIAVFLPTADFAGNKNKIYADSRKKING